MIALYVLFGLASLGTLLSGIAAVMGLRTHSRVASVDRNINGRMDQLLEVSTTAAHATGVIEGHAAGRVEQAKEDAT